MIIDLEAIIKADRHFVHCQLPQALSCGMVNVDGIIDVVEPSKLLTRGQQV
jgi:hypothetical protein